jgi:uncharacterized protein (UPF0335 family)
MINNPAKRLSEIEQLQKELQAEANDIKDVYRKLSKGRAEMFDFDWTKKILVQAQRKSPIILVRKEVDNALMIALRNMAISKRVYNKCYTKGSLPKPTVKLIDA